MERVSFIICFFSLLAVSCGNPGKKSDNTTATDNNDVKVYAIDDLFENPDQLVEKEIIVKGTVFHVCKQGGGRCFLMGSREDVNIRVEAGEKIGAFNQQQLGSDLIIKGIFREVKTEADAHNPEGDHSHDDEANEVHQVIEKSQGKFEIVYFIQGIEIVNEEI